MNLGRFYFQHELLFSQPELFLPVFAEMVVISALPLPEGVIEFTALSNRFGPTPPDAKTPDEQVPQYNVTPTVNGVDVVRV